MRAVAVAYDATPASRTHAPRIHHAHDLPADPRRRHPTDRGRRSTHRARTWPNTANPHLFINRKTAPRLTRSGRYFPWVRAGISPQALREDRILNEIHATGGDVRRICDLFGVTIDAALRYAHVLDETDEPTATPASDERVESVAGRATRTPDSAHTISSPAATSTDRTRRPNPL